jgi:hypothetical protein
MVVGDMVVGDSPLDASPPLLLAPPPLLPAPVPSTT